MNEVARKEEVQPLSTREQALLDQLEADIAHNMKGFLKVGYALTTIRDQALYRVDYDTFEDYCRETWDLGRPRAYQLIDSYLVVDNLSTMVDKTAAPKSDSSDAQVIELLPVNERQTRPLAPLAPEMQIEIWTMVIDRATENNCRITASMVQQCVDELLQKKIKDVVDKGKRTVAGDVEPGAFEQLAQSFLALAQRESEEKKKRVAGVLRELLEVLEA